MAQGNNKLVQWTTVTDESLSIEVIPWSTLACPFSAYPTADFFLLASKRMDFWTRFFPCIIFIVAVITAKCSNTVLASQIYTDSQKNSTQRRLRATETEEATVTLPLDFFAKCGDYCQGGGLPVSTHYYPDTSSYGHIVADIFPHADPVIVSGVMDVLFSSHTGGTEICPEQACIIKAHMPVEASKYNESKAMVCMRVEEERAVGGCDTSGICLTSYNTSTGMATCESTMMGELFVLQYTSPFSLPPIGLIIASMEREPASKSSKHKQVVPNLPTVFGTSPNRT